MHPERSRGIIATVLAALLWSTGGLFIKLLPQDAWTILFYRSAYAAVVFGLLYGRSLLRTNGRMWVVSSIYMGLLVTFVVSTKLTTAANAIFLQYTGTAYVLLLEPRLFRTPLLRINLWTTVVCFLGMGLFFMSSFDPRGGLGIALAIVSGVLLAGLFLGQRLNGEVYQVSAIFWGNVGVMFIGLPAFLQSAPPTLSEHAMLAFLGLVQIGLGYVLFTYGLKRVLAVESALITMLEPVLNPVWVLIGYGERPGVWSLVGGSVIVTALVVRLLLLEIRRRRQRAFSQGR